jgi:hypothetical protein
MSKTMKARILFLLPDAEIVGKEVFVPRISAAASWRARQLWVIHVGSGLSTFGALRT